MTNLKQVKIEGNTYEYFTIEDYKNGKLNDPLVVETFKIANYICNMLHVKVPYISFVDQIIRYNPKNGTNSVTGANTFRPQDCPALDNHLVVISVSLVNEAPLLYEGTLAHELRHIWQDKYAPELNEKVAEDFGDSLLHQGEIDADGFGIWYIAKTPEMNIKKAASRLCPEEKKRYPKAYFYREEAAKEIEKEMSGRVL